jgi:8-amino-7-oxononanoate synthase
MGTFSKAFGAYGAYVAASEAWVAHLVSACRTLIYSTALPPAVVGTIDAALDLVVAADGARAALRAKAERFRVGVQAAGFDTGGSTTQIVPALVGESERVLALAAALEERGVLAVGIRPPTVPAGTARLRFSLMATHTDDQLELALRALADAAA